VNKDLEYMNKEFGKKLKERVFQGCNYHEISKWAFSFYIDNGLEFEDGLYYFVLKIVAMEEGPEFFISKSDLIILAEKSPCLAQIHSVSKGTTAAATLMEFILQKAGILQKKLLSGFIKMP
jgi:hypothetical protein